MTHTGATLIADILADHGVRHIFEYPGGTIAPMLDAIRKAGLTQIVTMRHEQAAAFAADAYARVSGRTGVCMATSGPGATNLLTGIANAYLDSVPMVAITGQVGTAELRGDVPTRQMGFQELDICAMATPVCKSTHQIANVADIPYVLNNAFAVANHGRRGAVLIDIPANLQMTATDAVAGHGAYDSITYAPYIPSIIDILANSKAPLIIVGGGAQCVANDVRILVQRTNIPVVYSMMGKGVMPDTSGRCLGMIGWTGSRQANWAVQHADVILVLGSRLDARQTGLQRAKFAPNARIIHIDIDATELNKRINVALPIVADLAHMLPALCAADWPQLALTAWHQALQDNRIEFGHYAEYPDCELHYIFGAINACKQPNAVVTTDVGQHQIWAAQMCNIDTPNTWVTSAGLGAMGYGLPAAIGAWFADPTREIINITGDGSIQMNIQELAVVAQYHIPIKIVLFNNHCLGLVRQHQQYVFDGVYQSTVDGYQAPNFGRIIAAYGIDYINLTSNDPYTIFNNIWDVFNRPGPVVINITMDQQYPVYPMVLGTNALDAQYPYCEVH